MKKLLPKRGRRDCLEQLFASQLKTLAIHGCPQEVVDELRAMREPVLALARQHQGGEKPGWISFLPVISSARIKISHQMEWVSGPVLTTGRANLNEAKLRDCWEAPAQLYYIFNVADGREFCYQFLEQAEEAIAEASRLPLTAAEGIALAIHTPVLESHGIDLIGSRYGFEIPSDEIPLLWHHGEEGQPELIHVPRRRFGLPKRGVPSRDKEVIALFRD